MLKRDGRPKNCGRLEGKKWRLKLWERLKFPGTLMKSFCEMEPDAEWRNKEKPLNRVEA